MLPGQQPPRPWTDYVSVGRMPLGIAYLFSLIGTIGMTFALASIDASDSGETAIGFIWVVVPAPLTILIARYRHRRMLWWAAAGLAGIAFGQALPFLSATFLFTILFAAKPPIKIPESELEAQERRADLMTILSIRNDVVAVHKTIEERYMAREFSAMVDEEPVVKGADARITRIAPQVSPRGYRSRLHLMAGTGQLYDVLRAADALDILVREQPNLHTYAQGSIETNKGKEGRQVNKHLKEIEANLDRSRIQLSVCEGVLKDMGYEVPKAVPRPFMPPAPPAASEVPGAIDVTAASPQARRPRPAHSQRRNRF